MSAKGSRVALQARAPLRPPVRRDARRRHGVVEASPLIPVDDQNGVFPAGSVRYSLIHLAQNGLAGAKICVYQRDDLPCATTRSDGVFVLGGFKSLGEYYSTRATIMSETISGLAVATLNIHVYFLIFPIDLFVAFVLGIVNRNYLMCIPFIRDKIIWFSLLWGIIIFFIFAFSFALMSPAVWDFGNMLRELPNLSQF